MDRYLLMVHRWTREFQNDFFSDPSCHPNQMKTIPQLRDGDTGLLIFFQNENRPASSRTRPIIVHRPHRSTIRYRFGLDRHIFSFHHALTMIFPSFFHPFSCLDDTAGRIQPNRRKRPERKAWTDRRRSQEDSSGDGDAKRRTAATTTVPAIGL